MKVTYFTPDDYVELQAWWKKHNHNVLPLSALPVGVVVSSGDKNLVMSFVYTMDGCDVAQLAWTTSNPENKLKENYEAVNLAVDALVSVSKKLNKNLILCFSSSKGLTKILNKKNMLSNKKHVMVVGSF